jgi:hypothetical protein
MFLLFYLFIFTWQVMARLLDYIDQKYGGVSGYLDSIGFCLESQQQIFYFVTEEAPLTPLREDAAEQAYSSFSCFAQQPAYFTPQPAYFTPQPAEYFTQQSAEYFTQQSTEYFTQQSTEYFTQQPAM